MSNHERRIPWLLWPFYAIWRLVAFIIGLTGRLVAVILGFVLLIVGVIISGTIIGLIIGIPMIMFGVLLIIRGLF